MLDMRQVESIMLGTRTVAENVKGGEGMNGWTCMERVKGAFDRACRKSCQSYKVRFVLRSICPIVFITNIPLATATAQHPRNHMAPPETQLSQQLQQRTGLP